MLSVLKALKSLKRSSLTGQTNHLHALDLGSDARVHVRSRALNEPGIASGHMTSSGLRRPPWLFVERNDDASSVSQRCPPSGRSL